MIEVTLILTNFLVIFLLYSQIIQGVEPARLRRVVNGEKASSSEIFYQASLRMDGHHICGGTIISEKHVLTGAHCVADLFESPYEELTIVTGSEYLQGGNKHRIFNVSWHENFENGNSDYGFNVNDIAIVTLMDSIKFTETQHAAFLPKFPAPFHKIGTFSGFGRTIEINPFLSDVLLKGSETVIDRDECQSHMKYHVHIGQICGLAKLGVGICKGDSGGPLVFNNTIIGIASWNVVCGSGVPDVYTNVYDYLDFIQRIMSRHGFH